MLVLALISHILNKIFEMKYEMHLMESKTFLKSEMKKKIILKTNFKIK